MLNFFVYTYLTLLPPPATLYWPNGIDVGYTEQAPGGHQAAADNGYGQDRRTVLMSPSFNGHKEVQ
jgi:hypothetical protein